MLIGIIGPDFLFEANQEIYQAYQVQTVKITDQEGLAKLDGLMISGWQKKDYRRLSAGLCAAIRAQATRNLVIMGAARGAYELGRNGCLKIMDYQSYCRAEDNMTTVVLELPSWENLRLNATFGPTIQFQCIAPNLGIICKDKRRGPVLLRQGNYLACSFVPELTKNKAVYQYFIEMIEKAKKA